MIFSHVNKKNVLLDLFQSNDAQTACVNKYLEVTVLLADFDTAVCHLFLRLLDYGDTSSCPCLQYETQSETFLLIIYDECIMVL